MLDNMYTNVRSILYYRGKRKMRKYLSQFWKGSELDEELSKRGYGNDPVIIDVKPKTRNYNLIYRGIILVSFITAYRTGQGFIISTQLGIIYSIFGCLMFAAMNIKHAQDIHDKNVQDKIIQEYVKADPSKTPGIAKRMANLKQFRKS